MTGTAQTRDPKGPPVGRIGVLLQLALAGVLATFATLGGHPTPEPIPRGLALGLLYATPAVIAWLGITARRRSLLAAAALADVAGAPLSWSGLTLLFLVPAILFMGETGRIAGGASEPWGWLRGVVVGLVIPGLLVGAGVALLGLTEPLCWIATDRPGGPTYVIVPSIDNVPFGVGQSGGCTSAALTVQGAGAAAVLAIGAIALGWLAAASSGGLRAPSAGR